MTLDIDSVVFDMDGTLINLGGHVEWQKAQAEMSETYIANGCSPQDMEACSAREVLGMLDEMLEMNTRKRGAEKANSVQKEAYRILQKHEMRAVPSCSLMPSCLDALNWVKEQGIPMGVCTSNMQATAEKVLKTLGLRDYFDVVIGRSTAYKMKPSPDQLKACYERLEAKPKNSVYVGDSPKDVVAGKALGSYTVAVPMYFTRLDQLMEAGVDAVIKSLAELPQAIVAIKK